MPAWKLCGARGLLAAAMAWVVVGTAGPSASRAAPPGGNQPVLAPKGRAAVTKAVGYLSQKAPDAGRGYASLAALALLKAGEPASSPAVASVIAAIEKKFDGGTYKPTIPNYEAGVDAMVLATADPVRYRDRLQVLAEFILSQQDQRGFWDYPPPKKHLGDTSMTQYGLLGLWAAAQAGIEVPRDAWERAGQWLIQTQLTGGAFQYRPGEEPRINHGLTAAGTGSLEIVALHLFPGGEPTAGAPQGPKFGVLERVELAPQGSGSRLRLEDLKAAANRGVQWLAGNFQISRVDRFPMYYLYALERVAALTNAERIGSHDWYTEGVDHLATTQLPDGSWKAEEGDIGSTAFAVLFIVRATQQVVGKPPEPIGSGLLAGGRGLPTDLSTVQVRGGEIQTKAVTGPLDDLLTQLGTVQNMPIEAVQEAIVQKVQLGDREALIGQKERLRTLVDHPDVEVRRTALWALGRSGDLDVAGVLVKALADPNIDVAIEARNALCFVSRQPLGFGEPESPAELISEDAPEQERQVVFRRWQEDVRRKWTEWYLRVRPYDERDDLLEAVPPGKK